MSPDPGGTSLQLVAARRPDICAVGTLCTGSGKCATLRAITQDRSLLLTQPMRASVGLVHDMTVLAQLHAALDVVVETEATIRESGASSPAIDRLGQLMHETRELLRSMLARHPANSGL